MDGVKTYEDGIACAFDLLKVAACNTDDERRSEILEEAAEDIIELAPTYKREWKDLTAALAREAALVETIRELSDRVVAGDGREAALREELATSNKVGTAIGETLGRVTAERDDLHKRLTAAEQRNEELVELLQSINAKASKSHISQSLWQLKTDMANIAQTTDGTCNKLEVRQAR